MSKVAVVYWSGTGNTEAKKNDVNIVRTHSSSAASLTSVLETYLSESRAC